MSNISIVNLSAYTSPVIQENKKGDYSEGGIAPEDTTLTSATPAEILAEYND